MNFDLKKRTILLTMSGSRAYGTYLPSSDIDLMGIAVPTKEYFFGFSKNFEQAEGSHLSAFFSILSDEEKIIALNEKMEGVVYDLRKFMKLASENNPNIFNALFCREQEVRYQNKAGEILRESANLFISSKCHFSYQGYAFSQLKRIKNHREYLLNPPKKMPSREDFGLPEKTLIPPDQLEAARACVKEKMDSWSLNFGTLEPSGVIEINQRIEDFLSEIQVSKTEDVRFLAAAKSIGLTENIIFLMQKEREYENAKKGWAQYQNWKSSRNLERAKLEEKFGYDTKHASHLVRLIRMGSEILTTGKVNIWRGDIDAQELLDIRNGSWTYDKLIEYSQLLSEKMEEIYRSGKYIVPKTPNREKLDLVCQNIIEKMME